MWEIYQPRQFAKRLKQLKNQQAKAKIAERIARLEFGDFGDCKWFGGIGELRILIGKGYRIYFVRQGNEIMAIKLTKFDAADYLDTSEAQAEFITAAMESGGPKHIAACIGTVARARGMSEVARQAGITREALYRSLSEKGDPRLSTLLGVLKALDIKLSVVA